MSAISSMVNPYDIDAMPIAELRKMATVMKIDYEKDWKKDQYVAAINTRRRNTKAARIITDENDAIPPGFARIRLPLTPAGSDTPLWVRVNNFVTAIPRDVIVDIPLEARDQIQGSKEATTREVIDSEGKRVTQVVEILSQPFTQIGYTSGVSGFVRPSIDPRQQRVREQFRSLYGRWPGREEERKFRDQFMEKVQEKRIKQTLDQEDADAAEAETA